MPKLNLPRNQYSPQLESEILRDVRKWLAEQPDISIHRNNTGGASLHAEDFVRAGMDPESAQMAARTVAARFRGMRFGLAIGSSDLIGSITCTHQHVIGETGQGLPIMSATRIARALAIELKQPGKRPTDDQERFLEAKRKIGWVAFWADNLQTVQEMIGRARRWEL